MILVNCVIMDNVFVKTDKIIILLQKNVIIIVILPVKNVIMAYVYALLDIITTNKHRNATINVIHHV